MFWPMFFFHNYYCISKRPQEGELGTSVDGSHMTTENGNKTRELLQRSGIRVGQDSESMCWHSSLLSSVDLFQEQIY